MQNKTPVDINTPTFKKTEIELEYFKLLDQNYNKEKYSLT